MHFADVVSLGYLMIPSSTDNRTPTQKIAGMRGGSTSLSQSPTYKTLYSQETRYQEEENEETLKIRMF